MSPQEKRTLPKEFEQTHQVMYISLGIYIYINVYVSTHTQPPSWGVMFENPRPPPKKRGEDNLHRQNTTLKC